MPLDRRRRFIVLVPFQARFILFRIILLVILSLFLWILVFYPLQIEIISDMTDPAHRMTESGIPIPSLRVLLGMAAVFVLMGAMAMFESHRIVGPLFRFEATMKGLLAGDFPQQVKLRRHDNFTHLEPVLNDLAARFETGARAARGLREALAPGLDELAALCGREGIPAAVRSRVEALRAQVQQVLGDPA